MSDIRYINAMLHDISKNVIDLLFDRIPMGLAVFDDQLRLVRTNPTWASFVQKYTYTKPELIKPGVRFYDLAPGTEEFFSEVFSQVLAGEVVREPALYSISDGIESYWDVLLTPLEEDGKVIGFLDAVTDVTDQIRVKEYLEDQIFERTQSLVTLLQISRSFSSILDLNELLTAVLNELKRLVEYDGCALLQLEDETLEVKATTGCLVSVYKVGDQFAFDNELDQNLFTTSKAVKISDVHDNTPCSKAYRSRTYPESDCIRSWMGLALRVQDRVIGELVLVHHTTGFFNEVEDNYIQIFSSLAAIALENARLYQMEQERRQESERRQRVAEGLRDILKALNSNKPLEDLLIFIVDQVHAMMGADLSIRYHENEDQPLNTAISKSFPRDVFEKFAAYTYSNPQSDIQMRLSRGEYLIDEDYHKEVEELKNLEYDIKHPQVYEIMQLFAKYYHCGLILPLLVRGKLFGSLRFFYRDKHEFDDETIQLAMMIAEQTALAIENSTLRKEAQLLAVSNERNRLARELHDSVTQTLFSTSLIAEVLPRLFEVNKPEAEKRLAEMRHLARGALAEMRTLLMELRPNAIFEANPKELLTHLMDAYTGRSGIPVQYSEKIEPTAEISGEQKLVIYRIAQEALNNISKHATPSKVKILFHVDSDHVNLMIEDDGVGFDMEEIQSSHFGIGFMKERADGIGAQIKFISQPGEGTLVHLIIR
ncbi:MAG TPA: GAF domain-containing protein [Anaerolineaceae bacterium]|nr:GAF domain-containing protein [Anaerolineaceae bacterium]